MSQRGLAHISGVAAGYIARIEADGAIPGAEKIERLAKALDIPLEEIRSLIERSRQSLRTIKQKYPEAIYLFEQCLMQMNEKEIKTTFGRFEKRLSIFEEDKERVAENIKKYFLGELKSTDKPKNGTRPLCHYWISYSQELEEWDNYQENNNGYESNRNQGELEMNNGFSEQTEEREV